MESKHDKMLTKKFLEDCFNKEISVEDIVKEYNLSVSTIKTNIKKFSLKEFQKCKICGSSENLHQTNINGKIIIYNTCDNCITKKKFNNKTKILTKEFLEEQIKNKKLISEISIETEIKENHIKKCLDLYSLKEYHRCQYCGTEENLYTQSVFKKIRIFNVCKNCKIKHVKDSWNKKDENQKQDIVKKRELTSLEKFGVTNPSKSKIVIDKIYNSQISNIDENGLNSYQRGSLKTKKTWNNKTEEEKHLRTKKIQQTCMKRYGVPCTLVLHKQKKYSKISQEYFWNIYKLLPDDLKKFCQFAELNEEAILKNVVTGQAYKIDFFISNIKFVLEFYGNYWHALDYTDNQLDIVPFSFKKLTVREIREQDLLRLENIDNSDFYTFVITEKQYRENKKFWVDYAVEEIIMLADFFKNEGEI